MKYLSFVIYVVYLFLLISLSIIIVQPFIAVAEPIKSPTVFNYKEGDKVPEFVIDNLISKVATGTKAYQIKRTIFCESGYWNIKSNLDEASYGIAQIYLPAHPEITKSQSLDVNFSVKWMSDNWNTKWYGYSRELDRCNN